VLMEPNETILCGVCGRIVAAVGYICPRCGTNYSPIPVPIQDWPAFWQSLTPAETAAALRAAPKVAGPWSTPHARTGYWVRRAAITSEVVAKVESEDGKDRYYASILDADSSGQTDSLWAAQAAADAALVAKGWVLL